LLRLGLVEAIDHPSGRAAVLKLKQRPASSLRDLCSRNLDRAATHTLNGRVGEAGRNQLIDRIDLHPSAESMAIVEPSLFRVRRLSAYLWARSPVSGSRSVDGTVDDLTLPPIVAPPKATIQLRKHTFSFCCFQD
jgi:hypothetical protein